MINKINELLTRLWNLIVIICRRIAWPRKYCFYIEAELSDHHYKSSVTDMRYVSKSLTTEKTIEYLTLMTKGSIIVHDSSSGHKVLIISENDMEMINTYIKENKTISEDEKLICIWFDLYVDEDRFDKENENESK